MSIIEKSLNCMIMPKSLARKIPNLKMRVKNLQKKRRPKNQRLTSKMKDVFMRIMDRVEKLKSVNLPIPRKPASLLVNLAPVLKKVSANIAILGKFVLVFKALDIVL